MSKLLLVPDEDIKLLADTCRVLKGIDLTKQYKQAGEAEIERRVREARIEIAKAFVREFCNDHNGETRWLRSVALDMDHLLELILIFFKSEVK